MDYFEKRTIEAKKEITPTLLEIKKRLNDKKSLEGVVISTINGKYFDSFTDLGLALSYLLCISKTLTDRKEKQLNRALKEDYFVESTSDVESIMVEIVQVSIHCAEKNLQTILGVDGSKQNVSLIRSILLGVFDENDKEEVAYLRQQLIGLMN